MIIASVKGAIIVQINHVRYVYHEGLITLDIPVVAETSFVTCLKALPRLPL